MGQGLIITHLDGKSIKSHVGWMKYKQFAHKRSSSINQFRQISVKLHWAKNKMQFICCDAVKPIRLTFPWFLIANWEYERKRNTPNLLHPEYFEDENRICARFDAWFESQLRMWPNNEKQVCWSMNMEMTNSISNTSWYTEYSIVDLMNFRHIVHLTNWFVCCLRKNHLIFLWRLC